jgi:hypothetical protein
MLAYSNSVENGRMGLAVPLVFLYCDRVHTKILRFGNAPAVITSKQGISSP